MKQYVKSFESFITRYDKKIIGNPSGTSILVSDAELEELISQGIVFCDTTNGIPEGEVVPLTKDGCYTYLDHDLETIEEVLHRDVDHDDEAGEDPIHVAKVLGDGIVEYSPEALTEIVESINTNITKFSKLLEDVENDSIDNKSAVVRARPIPGSGGKYAINVQREVYTKQEAAGKKLYSIPNKSRLILAEVKLNSKHEATISYQDAYYLKPELADKLNELGVHTEKLIELKKELFFASVYHAAIGSRDAFKD
jgi:hypothetical protein